MNHWAHHQWLITFGDYDDDDNDDDNNTGDYDDDDSVLFLLT